MPDLTTIFHHLQRQLFPALTAELGPLSALDQQFCEVISLTNRGRFTRSYEWCGNGAPPCPRLWLAHACIAKSVYQFPLTSALIDALEAQMEPLFVGEFRAGPGVETGGDAPGEGLEKHVVHAWRGGSRKRRSRLWETLCVSSLFAGVIRLKVTLFAVGRLAATLTKSACGRALYALHRPFSSLFS